MKKIFLLILCVLLLASCGSHLYDGAITNSVVNESYDILGEYAVIKADSDEVTKETLEDVYFNYFQKKDLAYLVIVYNDNPSKGVYMIGNMVEKDVTLMQDKNADYMLADDSEAVIYIPNDGSLKEQ